MFHKDTNAIHQIVQTCLSLKDSWVHHLPKKTLIYSQLYNLFVIQNISIKTSETKYRQVLSHLK